MPSGGLTIEGAGQQPELSDLPGNAFDPALMREPGAVQADHSSHGWLLDHPEVLFGRTWLQKPQAN